MIRRRRKNRFVAPATVKFTRAANDQGARRLCVYAQCQYGGAVSGPTWSHTDAAVRRCLAELTRRCGCGRRFHRMRYAEGRRVLPAPR